MPERFVKTRTMTHAEYIFEEPALAAYVAGLKAHDVTAIGASLAEEVRFVTPVKTMAKPAIL